MDSQLVAVLSAQSGKRREAKRTFMHLKGKTVQHIKSNTVLFQSHLVSFKGVSNFRPNLWSCLSPSVEKVDPKLSPKRISLTRTALTWGLSWKKFQTRGPSSSHISASSLTLAKALKVPLAWNERQKKQSNMRWCHRSVTVNRRRHGASSILSEPVYMWKYAASKHSD